MGKMSGKCPDNCPNVRFRSNVREMFGKCPKIMSKCPESRSQQHNSDQCLRGFRSNVRTNVQMSGQTIRLLIRAKPLGLFDGPAISPLKSVCPCRDIHGSYRVTMYGQSIMLVGVA